MCSTTADIIERKLESEHTSTESPRRDLDLKTVFASLWHVRGLKGTLNPHLMGDTPRSNCYRCATIGSLHIFEDGLRPYICFLRLPCVKIGCQLSISTDQHGEMRVPPLSLLQGDEMTCEAKAEKTKRNNSIFFDLNKYQCEDVFIIIQLFIKKHSFVAPC